MQGIPLGVSSGFPSIIPSGNPRKKSLKTLQKKLLGESRMSFSDDFRTAGEIPEKIQVPTEISEGILEEVLGGIPDSQKKLPENS